jgi:inhibitor of cysteine peptidase
MTIRTLKVKEILQKEIKKKTQIYGAAAILVAIVFSSLIFTLGTNPNLTPFIEPPIASAIQTFTDETQLREYISTNAKGSITTYRGSPLDTMFFAERGLTVDIPQEPAPSYAMEGADSGSQSNSYSTTNIQVAGVDEADIIKNDGQYLYISSNDYTKNQNYVYILKADPQDPRIISKISLENNTYLAGMYISQDSNQLVIIGSQYQFFTLDAIVERTEPMIYPYNSEINTFLKVYDISDKAYPELSNNYTISGSYFNSRMIGDYVYTVISQPTYVLENNDLILPRIYNETAISEIEPTKIYYSESASYSDIASNYFTYTTFVGLNIKDNNQDLVNMTVLMGGASTMYVSINNIYVTYPTWTEEGQFTSIYRISINKDALNFEAKGSIPGYTLNQYSMDEYNGHFRLATTSQKQESSNNVYVLNMDLETVGKLENLGITERIYSARFMGDKAYLVTFRQIDPFFVLDMSNPTEPKVAGELKIPGYSSYLHPFDENHIIGLGMEDNTVKLSLFDVSNVNNPTEISKYTIQGDYAHSEALYDPKAFLFNKEKQLLVIPVSKTQYGIVPPTKEETNGTETSIAPNEGGYWQGAYIFKLNLSGFEFQGGVTHQENTNQEYYYGDYNQNVNRAIYIGNTLYTISNTKVKLNNLTDLTQIAEIKLN